MAVIAPLIFYMLAAGNANQSSRWIAAAARAGIAPSCALLGLAGSSPLVCLHELTAGSVGKGSELRIVGLILALRIFYWFGSAASVAYSVRPERP